jgi:predicted RecA/RadA family phage recombinase
LDVSNFSGPAPKPADAGLFGSHAAHGLAALNKQSRKELRDGARARFWSQKQAADARAAASAAPTVATPQETSTPAQ